MSTKTSYPADQTLLRDIAVSLISRHGITREEICVNDGTEGRVWRLAYRRVHRLNPSTLGRIINAMPEADLYGVHCGTWLDKRASGPLLQRQIAATVVICAMRSMLTMGERGATMHLPHQRALI